MNCGLDESVGSAPRWGWFTRGALFMAALSGMCVGCRCSAHDIATPPWRAVTPVTTRCGRASRSPSALGGW